MAAVSEGAQGPGWWQASDGRWYPPEQHPQYQAPAPPVDRPAPGQRFEYDAEVNKRDVNMRSYAAKLNARARQGWRLHTAFEQAGNTVTIYERPVG